MIFNTSANVSTVTTTAVTSKSSGL
jgi:hypothetical protein